MEETQASLIVRKFLQENPEYIPNVRQVPDTDNPGETLTAMDTEGLIAFTDWTIREGLGDVPKAKRFREHLRQKFGS